MNFRRACLPVFLLACLAACSMHDGERTESAPEGATTDALVVVQDYKVQVVGEPLHFDGYFTAKNGLRVTFESVVTNTPTGWSASALVAFGPKQALMTHTMTDAHRGPGMTHFSDRTPGVRVDPRYGLAIGDLAEVLYLRFPENARDRRERLPLDRGVDPRSIGVNKALLRNFTRMLSRWTTAGLMSTDAPGWDVDCDDDGNCDTTKGHGGGTTGGTTSGGGVSPGSSCTTFPTDTLTQINCESKCPDNNNNMPIHHVAEHDYRTPPTLPAGAHCDVTQIEVCGATQVTYAGQDYYYCTGRCGLLASASPYPGCQSLLHGRTSWQDCLDADACIVRHELGGSGVGSQGCAFMESQAIDDEIAATAADLAYYASQLVGWPYSYYVDLLYSVEECLVPDKGRNTGPVSSEIGSTCSCPPMAGRDTPFCNDKSQCVYPYLPTGSCTHSLCITPDAPLWEGCDTQAPGTAANPNDPNSCVTKVCAGDPYCCTTYWDATCRDEAVAAGCATCP
jgi:hypothetical protein